MSSEQEYFPLFLVFLSGLGFSIQGLIQKHLSEIGFHDTFVSVIVRGIVQAGTMAVSLYFDKDRRQGRNKYICGPNNFTAKIVFLRSICGFGSIAFAFLAFDSISLGDASVLVMLGPLVAAILSAVVLREPFLAVEMLATVLTLMGSALVAKPPFLFGDGGHGAPASVVGVHPVNQTMASPLAVVALGGAPTHGFNAFGVTCGLLASVAAGTSFMLLRLLGVQKNVKISFKNICLVQGVVQILLSVPAVLVAGQHVHLAGYTSTEYMLMLAGGVAGTLSQLVMTVGMQRVKSAVGSAMRMSDVAFSFAFQALFTKDPLDVYSIVGAVLVLAGISVMVVFKQRSQGTAADRPALEMTRYAQLNNNFNSGGSDATVMLGHLADDESRRPTHPLYAKMKAKLALQFNQDYMHLDQSEAGGSEHRDFFAGEEEEEEEGEGGSVTSDWSFNGELIGAAQAQGNIHGRIGGSCRGGGGGGHCGTYNPLSDRAVDQHDDNMEGGLSQIQVTEMEEEFHRQREEERLERARARAEAYRANLARLVDNNSYFNQLVQQHVGEALSSPGSGVQAAASRLHPHRDTAAALEEARHSPLIDVTLGSESATPLCSAPSSPPQQPATPPLIPIVPPLPRTNSPLLSFEPSPPVSPDIPLQAPPTPSAAPSAAAASSVQGPPTPSAAAAPVVLAAPDLQVSAPVSPQGVSVAAAVVEPPVPVPAPPPPAVPTEFGVSEPPSRAASDTPEFPGEIEESMAFYSCNNTNDALAALQMSMQGGAEVEER